MGASSASVGDAPFTEVVKIPHVTTTMETVWLRKSWSWIRSLALDAVLSRVGVQNLARACVCDSAVDARRGRWRRVQLIAFEAVPSLTHSGVILRGRDRLGRRDRRASTISHGLEGGVKEAVLRGCTSWAMKESALIAFEAVPSLAHSGVGLRAWSTFAQGSKDLQEDLRGGVRRKGLRWRTLGGFLGDDMDVADTTTERLGARLAVLRRGLRRYKHDTEQVRCCTQVRC